MSSEIVSNAVDEQQDRRRWAALAVIVAAQFMVVLDVAIVNVALPSIKTDLHFSQESLQWVVTAYAILFGGVLLLGGRLADLLGRRRVSPPDSSFSPSARFSTVWPGPRARSSVSVVSRDWEQRCSRPQHCPS